MEFWKAFIHLGYKNYWGTKTLGFALVTANADTSSVDTERPRLDRRKLGVSRGSYADLGGSQLKSVSDPYQFTNHSFSEKEVQNYHLLFSATKYEKGTNSKWGNHYVERTVVK